MKAVGLTREMEKAELDGGVGLIDGIDGTVGITEDGVDGTVVVTENRIDGTVGVTENGVCKGSGADLASDVGGRNDGPKAVAGKCYCPIPSQSTDCSG